MTSGNVIGTGAVTVDKDARLSGVTGTTALTNSSFTINGELVVGAFANATSGKINFGGKNVTISSTGKYVVGKGSCEYLDHQWYYRGCVSFFIYS